MQTRTKLLITLAVILIMNVLVYFLIDNVAISKPQALIAALTGMLVVAALIIYKSRNNRS